MGSCIGTDQGNKPQRPEGSEAQSTGRFGRWREEAGLLSTPPDGNFPMQNIGQVRFEAPTVPVIFILGGPGSGKVTHCDKLTQEKDGIVHINMTDLLQQYAVGNDMQDFSSLSSKTVTEVLMLEMKMSPGAKTFLVSGYPRNMRDVVEYSEKIQIVNGVVLLLWRQEALERQIDYGAQLGHVVLTLAKMELANFFRSVMPVAEYFDQSGLLIQVNGERSPNEVYPDFRDAVFKILGLLEDRIAVQDDSKNQTKAQVEVVRPDTTLPPKKKISTETTPSRISAQAAKTADRGKKVLPAFIWVIGGPGSNKGTACNQAVRNMPGWTHVNIGELLRSMADSNIIINDSITTGEICPLDIVIQVVEQQVLMNRGVKGIIINGFPRDLNQLQEFQTKFGQEPQLVLLDCSKLQLSRGRSDDSVSSFRKRLEIFREVTLPMLKTLDNENRLTVVDGDTDMPSVQQEFATVLYRISQHINLPDNTRNKNPNGMAPGKINGGLRLGNRSVPNGYVPTAKNNINKIKILENNLMPNGTVGVNKHSTGPKNGLINGVSHILKNNPSDPSNKITKNRVVPANVRKMYNEVENGLAN